MPPLITPADRIFVAGHRGMAGSAICRALERAGYHQLLTANRSELNLLNGPAVKAWFTNHQPTVVVLAAAKVGGIQANSTALMRSACRGSRLRSSCPRISMNRATTTTPPPPHQQPRAAGVDPPLP